MNRSSGFKIRIMIALAFAAFALIKYYSNSDTNEITGETQQISMSKDQEIALGLRSAPQMAQQYGGLSSDTQASQLVSQIGNEIVQKSVAGTSPYQFNFHLLADPETVNAFALPGGQVFITVGLLKRLENKDQLAGVLGHEIGHVIGRHSSEQIAKSELTGGLTGAAVMAAGDYNSAGMAQMINNMINMKFSRSDELESDELGVRFMVESGYNPEALLGVMRILDEASGGNRPAEFQSTHPSPENRVARIKQAIEKYRK